MASACQSSGTGRCPGKQPIWAKTQNTAAEWRRYPPLSRSTGTAARSLPSQGGRKPWRSLCCWVCWRRRPAPPSPKRSRRRQATERRRVRRLPRRTPCGSVLPPKRGRTPVAPSRAIRTVLCGYRRCRGRVSAFAPVKSFQSWGNDTADRRDHARPNRSLTRSASRAARFSPCLSGTASSSRRAFPRASRRARIWPSS